MFTNLSLKDSTQIGWLLRKWEDSTSIKVCVAENESMSTQGNHGKWKHLVANVRVILDNTFVQLAVGQGGELSGSWVPWQSRCWDSFSLDSCNRNVLPLDWGSRERDGWKMGCRWSPTPFGSLLKILNSHPKLFREGDWRNDWICCSLPNLKFRTREYQVFKHLLTCNYRGSYYLQQRNNS